MKGKRQRKIAKTVSIAIRRAVKAKKVSSDWRRRRRNEKDRLFFVLKLAVPCMSFSYVKMGIKIPAKSGYFVFTFDPKTCSISGVPLSEMEGQ